MITHKQFLKALRSKAEADLIISQYNLQESKKVVSIIDEAKSIMHTFQNGFKSDGECLNEAIAYLTNLKFPK